MAKLVTSIVSRLGLVQSIVINLMSLILSGVSKRLVGARTTSGF